MNFRGHAAAEGASLSGELRPLRSSDIDGSPMPAAFHHTPRGLRPGISGTACQLQCFMSQTLFMEVFVELMVPGSA